MVMRVGILCETSGVMRRAFATRGHEATSVDLLPADDGSNHHIVGNVLDYLNYGWDLLIVCHPPCTRLCNSGVRWLDGPPRNAPREATDLEREHWPQLDLTSRQRVMRRLLAEGADLFSACWRAPVDRVAIENPVMHKHGRALIPADLPKPQIVQPWWFGEPAFKATGFYLRNLPPLTATDRLTPPKKSTAPVTHKAWSAIHRAPPSPDRWKLRSRTFEGIAAACAQQWGDYAANQIEETKCPNTH